MILGILSAIAGVTISDWNVNDESGLVELFDKNDIHVMSITADEFDRAVRKSEGSIFIPTTGA